MPSMNIAAAVESGHAVVDLPLVGDDQYELPVDGLGQANFQFLFVQIQ